MGALSNGMPKQYISWQGLPLFLHSLAVLVRGGADGISLVVPKEYFEYTQNQVESFILDKLPGTPVRLAIGGPRRMDSVKSGLANIPRECEKVLIHDAARPFLTPALVRRIIESVDSGNPAVVPGIPVSDTIKLITGEQESVVESSLSRSRLRAVQTPQGFMASAILSAYEATCSMDIECTDDAMLWEAMGGTVKIVEGEETNLKITTPADLGALKTDEPGEIPCSGFGYDVHRYGPGRPLRLGGIPIPCAYEVIAHSDGDVLLHSIMDAMLGAGSLGDIGRLFPDNDPALSGISSSLLLDEVKELLRERSIAITHIDCTVVAQKPRLAPYADQIRKNIARLTDLDLDAVNFKATTEESMGFTGACEGIKAYAVVSALKRRS